MSTTNLNIRTDKEVKAEAERVFSELGLNMTTAINMFLKAAIRTNSIPFELKLDAPNKTTIEAIEEGRRLLDNPDTPRYSSIADLKRALEV